MEPWADAARSGTGYPVAERLLNLAADEQLVQDVGRDPVLLHAAAG